MQQDCVFKVDYDTVNRKIEDECKRGLEFLQKAIEAPINVTQEKIKSRFKCLENQIYELEKQNNLLYQFKKYLWEIWRVIYHYYIPIPIKKMIGYFWTLIKQ